MAALLHEIEGKNRPTMYIVCRYVEYTTEGILPTYNQCLSIFCLLKFAKRSMVFRSGSGRLRHVLPGLKLIEDSLDGYVEGSIFGQSSEAIEVAS